MADINPEVLDKFLKDPNVSKADKDTVVNGLRARNPLSQTLPNAGASAHAAPAAPPPGGPDITVTPTTGPMAGVPEMSATLEAFHRPDPTPDELEQFGKDIGKTAGGYAATGVRMGATGIGAVLGTEYGSPRLGAAGGAMVGDVVAQNLIEKPLGLRENYNYKETLAQGGLGFAAPSIKSEVPGEILSPVKGLVTGGLYGGASTSITSLAEKGELPPVGQLALGVVAGSLLTGAGRRFFQPAIAELSPHDVAPQVAAILNREVVPGASQAEREAIAELTGGVKNVRRAFRNQPLTVLDHPPITANELELKPIDYTNVPLKPAVRADSGEVVTGWDHGDAYNRAVDRGLPMSETGKAAGWKVGDHFVADSEIGSGDPEEMVRKIAGERYSASLTRRTGATARTRGGKFLRIPRESDKPFLQLGEDIAASVPSTPSEPLPYSRNVLNVDQPDVIKMQKMKGDFDTHAGSYFGPLKAWFSRTQTKTGIPVYRDVFDPTEQAVVSRIKLDETRAREMKYIYQGTKEPTQEKYQAWLESPNKDQAAKDLRLAVGDRQRTMSLRETYQRVFKSFGLTDPDAVDKHFTEYVPRMRTASRALGPDADAGEVIDKAFPMGVPRSVDFFRKAYEDGTMGFNDTNSRGILARMQSFGSWKTLVGPYADAAERAYVNNPDIPDGIRSTVKHYLEQIHGGRDYTGNDFAAWMQDFTRRVPGFRNLTTSDIRELTDAFINLPYGSTMGFRPGPLIRNGMQTAMTGYSELGGRWLGTGWKQALSTEGQQLAERLGINEGQPTFIHEFSAGMKQPTSSKLVKLARASNALATESLKHYNTIDEFNRNVMGLGQYARAMNAIQKAHGNPAKFIDYAWLDSGVFHKAEQNVLMELAYKGDFAEAARRSAIAMADNTQWVMRAGNRPAITTGTAGRALQFYSWGSYYANYLRRVHAPLVAGTLPSGKDALRLARFYFGTAALAGTAAEVGKQAGIEDAGKRALGWLGFGPAMYTGGSPVTDTILSGLNAAKGAATGDLATNIDTGDFTPAQKALGRNLKNFVPGMGLYKDFEHLANPDQGDEEAMLRTFGIAPRVPRLFGGH